jgi:hypothetical protein
MPCEETPFRWWDVDSARLGVASVTATATINATLVSFLRNFIGVILPGYSSASRMHKLEKDVNGGVGIMRQCGKTPKHCVGISPRANSTSVEKLWAK